LGEQKQIVYGSLQLNGITATDDVTFGGKLTAIGMKILTEETSKT